MMIESLLKPLLGYIRNCDNYFYKMTKLETHRIKQSRKTKEKEKI